MVKIRPVQGYDMGSSPVGASVAIVQWLVRQIVVLLMRVRFSLVTSWMGCLAAKAADCKSATKKQRRFESCPIHF